MDRNFLEEQPWLNGPRIAQGLVGMLGPDESDLFYMLARDLYSGRGTIVDAGSFLGKSAFSFASGLLENADFRSERDRVHCFDDFRVHEQLTVDLIARGFQEDVAIGDSSRRFFDRQVAKFGRLVEVHAGDFHRAVWHSQPIEVLMVDIAKSVSLMQRVAEVFFADLIPGVSFVIHQDYHHPWLPHIHVAMEYVADCFELVVPRADSSAVFRLTKEIPAEALKRLVAYDFTVEEQIDLMDAAIRRLPPDHRHYVGLARLQLLSFSVGSTQLRMAFDELERRCAEYVGEPEFQRGLTSMRSVVIDSDARAALLAKQFELARGLVEPLLSAGHASVFRIEILVSSLVGLGHHEEAARWLARAMEMRDPAGSTDLSLARMLSRCGRVADAVDVIVRGAVQPGRSPEAVIQACKTLTGMFERRQDTALEREALARLEGAIPGEPQVHVLKAQIRYMRGDSNSALRCLQQAVALGLPRASAESLLVSVGGSVDLLDQVAPE